MKERPILFKGAMVRAILDGTKTQTRRIVNDQPPEGHHIDTCHYNDTGWAHWRTGVGVDSGTCKCNNVRAPFGHAGDRLWVRETFRFTDDSRGNYITFRSDGAVHRVQDNAGYIREQDIDKWKPSLFMPRWASRITLEVESVRVERLNDCSRGDAMAEGCPFPNMADGPDPRKWYSELWESINGPGSWARNEWVWVVEFRKINTP